MEKLLTVRQLAEYLDVPIQTLYMWSHLGTGPTPIKVGRCLRYEPAEVRSWLAASKKKEATA
ncbi:helix-turn-helix domain-containing protein [Streptomyces sp. Q6]|uniref:Helix-turn-helix domain-containing protein n=1 Tax=Streptomyces citrinus TaxID=3118173 RepID=A0ACD5APQ7_9ACTN